MEAPGDVEGSEDAITLGACILHSYRIIEPLRLEKKSAVSLSPTFDQIAP